MQSVCQSLFSDGQSGVRVFVLRTNRIELISKPRLVTSGQQSSARRAAERRGYVSVCKSHTVSRQRIDVRRRNLRISLAAQFAVAEIIGQQHDNVWLLIRSAGRSAATDHSRDDRHAGQKELSVCAHKCSRQEGGNGQHSPSQRASAITTWPAMQSAGGGTNRGRLYVTSPSPCGCI